MARTVIILEPAAAHNKQASRLMELPIFPLAFPPFKACHSATAAAAAATATAAELQPSLFTTRAALSLPLAASTYLYV